MKTFTLFIFVITLFFSCKKEKQFNPDEHITSVHWYKTRSSSSDTLFSVYIPNTFTPNGDGMNDYFFPTGELTGNYYSLKVFDRDGSIIFNTTDRNSHWEGKKPDNTLVAIGVYKYQLKLNDSAGNEYEYEGSVALIL